MGKDRKNGHGPTKEELEVEARRRFNLNVTAHQDVVDLKIAAALLGKAYCPEASYTIQTGAHIVKEVDGRVGTVVSLVNAIRRGRSEPDHLDFVMSCDPYSIGNLKVLMRDDVPDIKEIERLTTGFYEELTKYIKGDK